MKKKLFTVMGILLSLSISAFAEFTSIGIRGSFDGFGNPTFMGGEFFATQKVIEGENWGLYVEEFLGVGGATYFWDTSVGNDVTRHSKKGFGWDIGLEGIGEYALCDWFSLHGGLVAGCIFCPKEGDGGGFAPKIGLSAGGTLFPYSLFSVVFDIEPCLKFLNTDDLFGCSFSAGVRLNISHLML